MVDRSFFAGLRFRKEAWHRSDQTQTMVLRLTCGNSAGLTQECVIDALTCSLFAYEDRYWHLYTHRETAMVRQIAATLTADRRDRKSGPWDLRQRG
jgi:hypothetical protein